MGSSSRRRIYSERLAPEDLAGRVEVLDALASRGIELLQAVLPGQREGAIRLAEVASSRGVQIGLWPLVDDARGRWLSVGNEVVFEAHADRLLEALSRAGLSPSSMVFDLEPPITEVRALLGGGLSGLARLRPASARGVAASRRRVRAYAELLHGDGVECFAALTPPALVPGRLLGAAERWLHAPAARLGPMVRSAMLYTSLFEGYGRGLVDRERARAWLYVGARAVRRRFGAQAAVSLGCVGVGALGDERPYRGVDELIDDVALARLAGLEDIALFELAGALERPPFEAWLDALVETAPAAGPPPIRAGDRVLLAALRALGRRRTSGPNARRGDR